MSNRWIQIGEAPPFVVPPIEEPDKAEDAYLYFAQRSGHEGPVATTDRAYAIEFEHNAETWVAEVGRELRGIRRRKRQRQGQRVDVEERLSSPTTVVAIVPPTTLRGPWRVWHTGPSEWRSRSL